jgi:hypothetical protein
MEAENAGVAIDLAIVLRDRSSSRVWDGRKGAVYIRGQRGTLRDQQCHKAIRWFSRGTRLTKHTMGRRRTMAFEAGEDMRR